MARTHTKIYQKTELLCDTKTGYTTENYNNTSKNHVF